MCMQSTAVRHYQRWHWNGDVICPDTTIHVSRRVPHSHKQRYDIDIREFIAIGGNSVIKNELSKITDQLPGYKEKLDFLTKGIGKFDYKANIIFEWFSNYAYRKSSRNYDQWLFPEETLANGGGDCEDLSFLLATMLIESGISRECVRVALGCLKDRSSKNSKPHDHAWVVYQTEGSAWQILDPIAKVNDPYSGKLDQNTGSSSNQGNLPDIEYIPSFVFNSEHLWFVCSRESPRNDNKINKGFLENYLKSRKNFWTHFNPSFALSVHNFIFDQALTGMSVADLLIVKAASLGLDLPDSV
jgi:Transglutaminase-like superfamily